LEKAAPKAGLLLQFKNSAMKKKIGRREGEKSANPVTLLVRVQFWRISPTSKLNF
jgi:hypothetical protein